MWQCTCMHCNNKMYPISPDQPGFAAFVKLTLYMDEPTLFGISKSYWDMLNGFANWFAAASSFLAAGMALYIANRSAKPSAKLSVGHRIIVSQVGAEPCPEFAVFRIVNTGDRPIRHSYYSTWLEGWSYSKTLCYSDA